MTPEELIADTNRLLRQLFEEQQRERKEGVKLMAESKEKLADLRANRGDVSKDRLRELGVPEEGLEGSSADWATRQKEALTRNTERLKEHQERDARLKEELLQELRIQSELLREIKEKLAGE